MRIPIRVDLARIRWGAGPSAVALMVRGPWTVGVLANHVWSYAGDNDRQDISNTFLQPFGLHMCQHWGFQ
jgi:hypothetical protein